MRKEMIQVGKTYVNGKGSARTVRRLKRLDVYAWAVQVEYEVTQGRQPRAPDVIGEKGEALFRCDLRAFQRWAKSEQSTN
jgi:hypothetical protein